MGAGVSLNKETMKELEEAILQEIESKFTSASNKSDNIRKDLTNMIKSHEAQLKNKAELKALEETNEKFSV